MCENRSVCTKLGRINAKILGYQLRRELHQIKRGQEIKILWVITVFLICMLCFALCAINSSQERNGGNSCVKYVLLLVFDKNQSRVYHQCPSILFVYLSHFFCAILLTEEITNCPPTKKTQGARRKEIWYQARKCARPRRIVQHDVQLTVGTRFPRTQHAPLLFKASGQNLNTYHACKHAWIPQTYLVLLQRAPRLLQAASQKKT